MACSHFPRLRLSEHNDVSDSYDRLSELPDSLLLLILSSLCSTRDAVRTTILSKRWKDLWATVPCLHFEDENPEFMRGVLAQWRGAKLRRFHLYWGSSLTSTDLESWLLFTVEKQVEELHVDLQADIPYYFPPQSLYSCSSITKLHLEYNCLLKIEGSVQLNQLETLSIDLSVFTWNDAINRLLSGAPRLKNLSLSMNEINGNFNITSLSLKTLMIYGSQIKGVLTVWAPNLLTSQTSAFYFYGAGFLCHVPSLTEACFLEYYGVYNPPLPLETIERLWGSICHVTKLTLALLNIKLLLSMKKKDMFVWFPNAEVLEHIVSGYIDPLDFLDLLELFPKLKVLSLHRYKSTKDFNPINLETTFPSCSLLHLERVDMTWSAHDPSIISFIEILLQNAPSLHKMVFRLTGYTYNREELLMVQEKVRRMPRSSPTAEVIVIGG